MRIRSLTFDVDDTLYLERDYVRSGFRAAGAYLDMQYGVPGLGEACQSLFDQGCRGSVFNDALRLLGLAHRPSLVEELVETYRTHDPDIELLPDARRALEWSACLSRVGVVSGGPLVSQRAKARQLGVERFTSPVILIAEHADLDPKPSPSAFEAIEADHGFRGAACVYVADNPETDFAGPRALGWRTLRIRRSGSLHEHTASGSDVDLEIRSLEDLEGALTVIQGAPRSASGVLR